MRKLIAISMACAVGLHLILLQCVAWIGMAVVYTQQEESLAKGLSMTFDGDHPCALCDAIQAEQERGAQQDAPTVPAKEIKLPPMTLVSADFLLPQIPPATFGRHPNRLGEPCSLAASPIEKPPQTV